MHAWQAPKLRDLCRLQRICLANCVLCLTNISCCCFPCSTLTKHLPAGRQHACHPHPLRAVPAAAAHACPGMLALTGLPAQTRPSKVSGGKLVTYIAKCRCVAAQVSASNRGPSRSLRQYGCFDIFGISFNCNDRGRRDEDDWRRRERGAPHTPQPLVLSS